MKLALTLNNWWKGNNVSFISGRLRKDESHNGLSRYFLFLCALTLSAGRQERHLADIIPLILIAAVIFWISRGRKLRRNLLTQVHGENSHYNSLWYRYALCCWCCWLGGRKGIRPVKNWVVRCWRGYLSGARCRLAYGSADVTATHCLLLQ